MVECRRLLTEESMGEPEFDVELLGDHMKPSLDLLKYYRQRLLAFDDERRVWLQKLADMEVRARTRGILRAAATRP